MCDRKYLRIVVQNSRDSFLTLKFDTDTLEIDRKFEDVPGDDIVMGDNVSYKITSIFFAVKRLQNSINEVNFTFFNFLMIGFKVAQKEPILICVSLTFMSVHLYKLLSLMRSERKYLEYYQYS